MDSHATFLNCPAYMDKDGGTRCGLPAEIAANLALPIASAADAEADLKLSPGH